MDYYWYWFQTFVRQVSKLVDQLFDQIISWWRRQLSSHSEKLSFHGGEHCATCVSTIMRLVLWIYETHITNFVGLVKHIWELCFVLCAKYCTTQGSLHWRFYSTILSLSSFTSVSGRLHNSGLFLLSLTFFPMPMLRKCAAGEIVCGFGNGRLASSPRNSD